LLLILQGDVVAPQINRVIPHVKHRRFDSEIFAGVLRFRYAELVNFCLMPNHFHLIVRELKEGGISKFMQRLSDAYTKYFNIKYSRTGHLFGGKFQSIHIDQNEYLKYVSAYIHLNPRDLKQWNHKEIQYPWSSFQDLSVNNRFGEFLNPSIILDQFDSGREYQDFVEETPIKEIKNEITPDYLID